MKSLQKIASIVGGVGFMILAIYYWVDPLHLTQSYLIGFLFALAGTLGSIVLLCIIHLSGGAWGHCIRRVLEAGTQTLWLMALLFIPIVLFGMESLYGAWLHPETDPHHIVATKTLWLNKPGFIIRAVLYFAIWYVLARYLYAWSVKQDKTGDLAYRRKLKALSGPAIIIYAITVTFASVDWVMSIEPTWFSSIYGVLFMMGHGLTVWAFSIIMVVWRSREEPMKSALTVNNLHNLGSFLFAFVVLWAYIELSQFIIIWSGNLPEEIPWYMNRSNGGFKVLSSVLVMFQFVVPFFILLSRISKKKTQILLSVSIGILFMRIVDLIWIVAPSIHQPVTNPSGLLAVSLVDFIAPLAFGALWFALFLHYYRKLPILPLKDPFFSEGFDQTKETEKCA